MPDEEDRPARAHPLPHRRVTRHVQPLGPRVLVRVLRGEDRSEAGLYLPPGAKDAAARALLGEVVEVARTLPKTPDPLELARSDEDEKADLGTNVSGIPVGANVLFLKERAIPVPWDEDLRILEVRHVLALVDIVPEEELQ